MALSTWSIARRAHAIRAAANSRTSATSATNTTTHRPPAIGESRQPTPSTSRFRACTPARFAPPTKWTICCRSRCRRRQDRSSRSREMIRTPVRLVVSLDAKSPRVTWQVTIDNHSKDHRLRLLFPLGVESITDVRAETAFGVARRAARREVPAEVRVELPVSYGPTGAFTEAGSATAGAIVLRRRVGGIRGLYRRRSGQAGTHALALSRASLARRPRHSPVRPRGARPRHAGCAVPGATSSFASHSNRGKSLRPMPDSSRARRRLPLLHW